MTAWESFENATAAEIRELLSLTETLSGDLLQSLFNYVIGEYELARKDEVSGTGWLINYLKDEHDIP